LLSQHPGFLFTGGTDNLWLFVMLAQAGIQLKKHSLPGYGIFPRMTTLSRIQLIIPPLLL